MIGYLAGKVLETDEDTVVIDVSGVGYSVTAPGRLTTALTPGSDIRMHIHTHLRENALELFGFGSSWEKKVFLALTSVSGVGPRTAMTLLGGLEPETLLSAIMREDRATLTSISGVGKKSAERFIVELSDKARKLLAERGGNATGKTGGATGTGAVSARAVKRGSGAADAGDKLPVSDPADLWNEALTALVSLGYREPDALAAIKQASSRASETETPFTLENLVRSSLQLMSRGHGA